MRKHWKIRDASEVSEANEAIKKYRENHLRKKGMRKVVTGDDIRRATRAFKPGTSIGIDLWNFKEISLVPQAALDDLAEIITDIIDIIVPPIQICDNRMARIPKKQGGERTIAITATLYRLITEIDDQDIKN